MAFGAERWEVTINLDEQASDESWIYVSALPGDDEGTRALEVRLSMRHPFTQGFVIDSGRINEGVVRLAVGLAISEAIAQGDGIRFSGRIRSSLNELMLLGLADRQN